MHTWDQMWEGLAIVFWSALKVSQYEEDFKHEREDRIRAVKEKISIEEELKAYKKAGNEVPQSKKQVRV